MALVSNPSPPTAVQFPPFVVVQSPGTPRKSGLDKFPAIKANILLDIARHEFDPMDLYKLDLKTSDQQWPEEASVRSYPSLTPLTTYFTILSTFAAGGSNSGPCICIDGRLSRLAPASRMARGLRSCSITWNSIIVDSLG